MGVVEPVNPDVCICGHMKVEHGGKMTQVFKTLPTKK